MPHTNQAVNTHHWQAPASHWNQRGSVGVFAVAALVKRLNKKAEGLTSVSLCCHHRGNLGASGQAI
jgi:hypothetical protein